MIIFLLVNGTGVSGAFFVRFVIMKTKAMKRFFCLCVLLSIGSLLFGQEPTPTCVKDSLKFKGADHIYYLHVERFKELQKFVNDIVNNNAKKA